MSQPRVERWRYHGLGACGRCHADEAPGLRLYRPRVLTPEVILEAPICSTCCAQIDARLDAGERWP